MQRHHVAVRAGGVGQGRLCIMASELTLARCIGFGGSSGGCSSTNALSSAVALTYLDANVVAYSAGSTVVLMDIKSKQQLGFFRDESPGLPLGCLALGGGTDVSSSMPVHLAAGEQGGAAPQVLVWSVRSGQAIARLKQHKHGVSSVCFSPDGKQLLSAGSSYDGQVCLWDYQKGVLLARASAQAEIMAATFAADGSIASAGKDHLKVWGMTGGGVGKKLGASGSITLTPRAFSLKDLRSQAFVDVKSGGENSMYALTASGVLMYVQEAGSRTVDKTVNVQVAAAHSLAVSPHLVACTCSAGIVRLFGTHTLAFRANMPRPSPTHSAAQQTTGSVATALQRAGSFSGANGAAAHGMYSPELAMPVSGPGSKAASRHTAPTSLRCLKVSPDGSHLAIGDAQGNVRIYSLATLTLIAFKVAHEGEVLSLDYGAGERQSGF
ncbi:WD40-repeat-containing domain protein [Dunaliella salina]|uniref:WD40-repeat-containing domain protein n=1 Tax=Dunaliella salina TaxID=3046 RepID=A0ABQ7FZC1_DUNSA|nr:WD40-repeat-containing domain protein [Dunaliella salina]|eukprot:KAF5827696.1 WD40-repeat-containing domain protein [Dunaliella salina]